MAHNNNMDDGLDEPSQSLEQRQVISDQMAEMLSNRLSYLQQLAQWRTEGLAADVDVHSDHCTAKVPKLKSSFAGDDSKPRRRHARKVSHISTSMGGGDGPHYSEKNLRRLERMGLPIGDGRGGNGIGKAERFNSQREKMENKRLQKSEIESELAQNLESFVTRSVENVTYKIGTFAIGMSPMEKQPKLLLSHALQRIATLGAERMLKHFTLNVLSRKLYCEAFWYTHCKHFQHHSEDEQQYLLEQMSATLVKLNGILGHHRDFFHRMYSYLVASAVTWGFHYVCPGSRHLYTASFKSSVFQSICEIIAGTTLCPVSVTLMRTKLFPEEKTEEVVEPPTEEELVEKEQNIVAGLLVDVHAANVAEARARGAVEVGGGLLTDADGDVMRRASAASVASVGSVRLRGSSEDAEGQQPPSPLAQYIDYSVGAAPPDEEFVPAPISRQERQRFEAEGLSPLVRSFLRHASDTGGKRSNTVLRTTPVQNCHVGGANTFRPKPSRTQLHSKMAREHRAHRSAFLKEKYGSLRRLQAQLQKIEERKHKVLRGGVSDVGGFCLQLVQRAEAMRRGDRVAADFTPSFRDDEDHNNGDGNI